MGDLHAAWAWVMVVANGVVGLWALAAHARPRLRHRSLWWATAAAEVAVAVQVVLGVAATTDTARASDLHVAYGAAALLAVGVAYGYRHQLGERRHLLYAGTGLFIMGIGLRELVI